MTSMIQLTEEEERRLAARASESGREVSEYIHWLIERDLRPSSALDRALGPFRDQVQKSGMTEDELGGFFEEVRDEVWKEKQARENFRVLGACEASMIKNVLPPEGRGAYRREVREIAD